MLQCLLWKAVTFLTRDIKLLVLLCLKVKFWCNIMEWQVSVHKSSLAGG